MKTPSRRLFTILLILLASAALPASFLTYAAARPDKPAARDEKTQALADLPPDARTAISDALRRDGRIGPESFTQRGKITASDGAFSDGFGRSVGMSGDTVVVGAIGHDIGRNSDQGAAYIFVKPAGGWSSGVQSAELIASDGGKIDNFGWSVSIDGDTVVVGALFHDVGRNFNQGAAYVFVKPAVGWAGTITENAKLTASDGASDDFFGSSVTVKGGIVAVGAYGDDIGSDPNQYNQGSAYVFVKPAGGWAGSLTENAKLTASDGLLYDQLGNSISLDGDTLVVGAETRGNSNNFFGGTAYVFVKPPAGWAGSLTESAQLFASDAVSNSSFSHAVSIAGDTIVASALSAPNLGIGAAYIFVKPPGGWVGSLTENAKLTASGAASSAAIGRSVAIAGDRVVAGAPGDKIGDNDSQGSAYLFLKPAGGWVNGVETAKLTASDGGDFDSFGWSVAVDGETVLVGAIGATVGSTDYQGAAYVFEDDAPAVSYVINYSYRFASGERQSGTNTLFADRTFQDSAGSGGTWALTQAGRLTLQYQGAPCDAFLSGRFQTPTKLKGTLRCTDGSGDTGTWQGTVIQQ